MDPPIVAIRMGPTPQKWKPIRSLGLQRSLLDSVMPQHFRSYAVRPVSTGQCSLCRPRSVDLAPLEECHPRATYVATTSILFIMQIFETSTDMTSAASFSGGIGSQWTSPSASYRSLIGQVK